MSHPLERGGVEREAPRGRGGEGHQEGGVGRGEEGSIKGEGGVRRGAPRGRGGEG